MRFGLFSGPMLAFFYNPCSIGHYGNNVISKTRIRVAARKRVYNIRRMDTMRDEVKTLKKMVLPH
jgi:hypothetical protein